MEKRFTENDFKDTLHDVIFELTEEAIEKGATNAAMQIMLLGAIIASEIKDKLFDEDTNSTTIEKE